MPIAATRSSSTSRNPAPDSAEGRDEPADRCPYRRPFDWEFSACPAFMPRLHLAQDTHGRQLPAHWTCAHLGGRRREEGGFYPACALGSAEGRVGWAASLKEGQLAAIRRARVELSQYLRPELERVREVIARRDASSRRPRREDLQSAWVGLDLAFARFVHGHRELFEAAGIESDALQRCFSEAMAEFSGRQWGSDWQMAESVVSRYAWPIVAFFRPDLVRDGATVETQAPPKP